jgi:hypothetical protein
MLMTESLISSAFLIGVGLAVRLLAEERWDARRFGGLLFVMAVAAQIRVYGVLVVGALAGVVVLRHRKLLRPPMAALGAVAVAAYLFLPAYRCARTGVFTLHGVQLDTLVYSLAAGTARGPEKAAALEAAAPLPPGMTGAGLLEKGMWYGDIHRLGLFWREQGAGTGEIVRRARRMAAVVRHGPVFWWHSAIYGLNSCGLTLVYRLGPASHVVRGSTTMKDRLYRELGMYHWLAWTYQASYRQEFNFLVRRNLDAADPGAAQWALFVRAWEPWLVDRPVRWRDPLGLGRLFPDVWFALGIGSGLWLLIRRPMFGLMVLGPVAANWLATASVPLGDARYAYTLFTLYAAAGAMVLGEVVRTRSMLPWRRNRGRMEKRTVDPRP